MSCRSVRLFEFPRIVEASAIGRVMAEKRRTFDREFRECAVRLVNETGKSVAAAPGGADHSHRRLQLRPRDFLEIGASGRAYLREQIRHRCWTSRSAFRDAAAKFQAPTVAVVDRQPGRLECCRWRMTGS